MKFLPHHITREFDEYQECGRLEHGFLRVRFEDYHHVYLVAFSASSKVASRHLSPMCGRTTVKQPILSKVVWINTTGYLNHLPSGIRVVIS